jgi:chemotaxis-related protein WspD
VSERFVPPPRCWRAIGVFGDRSCPELEEHVHCRNCPVFADAGRDLFERPLPSGYRQQWTQLIAEPKPAAIAERSLIVFRVAAEWLAVDTSFCVEVAEDRRAHPIAHRAGDVLAGLVNVRGELLLAVAMRRLLRIEGAPDGSMPARLLVVRRGDETWALQVDGVHGAMRADRAAILEVPATMTQGVQPFASGVLPWPQEGGTRTIGVLDGGRLFDSLRRRVG